MFCGFWCVDLFECDICVFFFLNKEIWLDLIFWREGFLGFKGGREWIYLLRVWRFEL